MVQEHFLIQVFPPKSVTVKPDGKTEGVSALALRVMTGSWLFTAVT